MSIYYTSIEIPFIFLGLALCMVCCLKKKPKPEEEEETLEQGQCPSMFITPLSEEGSVEAGFGGRVSELHGLPAYTLQDHNPPPSYWEDSYFSSEAPLPYTSFTPQTQIGQNNDDIINTRHTPYVPNA